MINKKTNVNSVPKQVELFGRTLKTIYDTDKLNIMGLYGQARYGINHIALTKVVNDRLVSEEELKLTYLHEMLHFILNFTGYEKIMIDSGKIDIEQFIEIMSSAIYQYEKSAKY